METKHKNCGFWIPIVHQELPKKNHTLPFEALTRKVPFFKRSESEKGKHKIQITGLNSCRSTNGRIVCLMHQIGQKLPTIFHKSVTSVY